MEFGGCLEYRYGGLLEFLWPHFPVLYRVYESILVRTLDHFVNSTAQNSDYSLRVFVALIGLEFVPQNIVHFFECCHRHESGMLRWLINDILRPSSVYLDQLPSVE